MPPLEKLLTMQEAADALSINRKTLLSHIRAGRLAYVNVGHGEERESRRFRPSDIAIFVQAQVRVVQPAMRDGGDRKRRKPADTPPAGGIRGLLARLEAEKRKADPR